MSYLQKIKTDKNLTRQAIVMLTMIVYSLVWMPLQEQTDFNINSTSAILEHRFIN